MHIIFIMRIIIIIIFDQITKSTLKFYYCTVIIAKFVK